MTTPLLSVKGLSIGFAGEQSKKQVVEDLELTIGRGEIVALVGESGSGKTMTALSLIRLLPHVFDIKEGSIKFDGKEVRDMTAPQLNELRGGRIGMIFQQPQSMLDPSATVGSQVAESLTLHRRLDKQATKARVIDLLGEVGIPEPVERSRNYAHQMSGGMAQRVMIAAALSADPHLLIADEPTTALDVTVQTQILKLLERERRERELAILLITHDLTVVSSLADRVVVMYAGRIVEEGPTRNILSKPRQPYTQALLRCSLLETDDEQALYTIPSGENPGIETTSGCTFLPRCITAADIGISEQCKRQEPPLRTYSEHCRARCWAVPPSEYSMDGYDYSHQAGEETST